ncbi:MAG: hypothetical protein AAGB04_15575 [Pseudomonadota bacterium]
MWNFRLLTEHLKTFAVRGLAFTVLCSTVAVASASAQNGMTWTFTEGNDPANGGRATARLVYGVPETDDQQVAAVCEARASTSTSVSTVILGADTGKLKNGARVKVRFSGGGDEQEIQGEVFGVGNTNEAISGVIIQPKHDSKIWTMLLSRLAVDYTIPGYRANRLRLNGAHPKINSFVNACKSYAAAAGGQQSASGSSGSSGAITEKEAFDIAKEIGSIDGWNAFLKQFPNGFRADLARAFVKRLSGQGGTSTSTAGTTTKPAATGAAPKTTKPTLPTVARGPSTSRWANKTQRLKIAGNKSVYTASVRVPGVEMVTYCAEDKRDGGFGLGVLLRRSGSYPAFSQRIRQGIAARPVFGNGPNREVEMSFSNGEIVDDAATRPRLTNQELSIGPNAGVFGEGSTALEYFMSESEVTVALEPFKATFQLTGSRKAICSVMNRCGASVPGCGDGGSTAVTPVTTSRCSGGRYFSRSKGRCVCPTNKSYWNGRSCQRLRCGKNYKLVRGKCVLLQNCGRNAYRSPEGDCYCNRGFRRTNSGRCVRRNVRQCGPGRTWVGAQGRCVCVDSRKAWNGRRCVFPRQRCTGGRTWQDGRCDCNGDSVWNGRQCVKENEPPPRQQNNAKRNVCAVLQTACQLGSNAACRNFQKAGC